MGGRERRHQEPASQPASQQGGEGTQEGSEGWGRGRRQKGPATRSLMPDRWKGLESQAHRPEVGGGGGEGTRANEGSGSSEQSSGHRKWKRRWGCEGMKRAWARGASWGMHTSQHTRAQTHTRAHTRTLAASSTPTPTCLASFSSVGTRFFQRP